MEVEFMKEKLTSKTHVYPIQIRFCDCDSLGHINNAVYLSYFEACRIDWLDKMLQGDILKKGKSLSIILARAEIDYLQQVYLHDQIAVHANIGHIGRTSFHQIYELVSPDRGVLARSKAVLVWFDIKSNQKSEIPDFARQFMEEYLISDNSPRSM